MTLSEAKNKVENPVALKDGSPVKICHITTIDISLENLLLNQMKSIAAEGFEVVGISSPGPSVAVLEENGIRHISVTMTRKITPFHDLASLWKLVSVMRKEKFSIVHTHNPKPGLLGQLAARLAGVPIVINTVHGFYFHDHMKPWARKIFILLEKVAALCSDSILSQNKDDIKTALTEKIASANRIKHLGNGIDISLFDRSRFSDREVLEKKKELGIDDGAPVIGFVGRLAHRKGFFDLLSAAEIILKERPDACFLIIGDTDTGKSDAIEMDELSSYETGDSCKFLGWRANEELPLLNALMDVLVLPSPWEGVPRAVMEATSMGIPAVVTNVKGCRDVVTEGENGYLVPFAAPEELAKAILKVINNPEVARRMGQRGREIALEKFNELDVFERVKSEYRALLQNKKLI